METGGADAGGAGVEGAGEVAGSGNGATAASAFSGVAAGEPVVEIARFDALPGNEDRFAAAYLAVRDEIAGSPGCRSVRMTRGVESPSSFVLLVEWDSLAAHLETFRGSERFARWRAGIGPHVAGPATVVHVTDIQTDIQQGAG
jgi:heme-degrading monooxygenase HmoA